MDHVLSRRTLFRDLVLALTAMTIVAVAIPGTIFYYISTLQENAEVESRAGRLSLECSRAISLPLMNLDSDTLGHIAEAYLSSDFITGISVYIDSSLFIEKKSASDTGKFVRNVPVMVGEKSVGKLTISFSRDSVKHSLQSVIRTMAVSVLSFLLCVIPAIYLVTQSIVHKPLKQMIQAIRTISGGDYETPLQAVPQQEINAIIREVNLMAENILERNRALVESEKRFRGIIENASDGIFQASADAEMFSANKALADIFGFNSPEELIADFSDIYKSAFVEQDDRKIIEDKLSKGGHITSFETRMYRKDGNVIWVKINSRPVYQDDGNLMYIEGFIENITDRKTVQDSVVKAKHELESQVELRTRTLQEKTDKMERMNRLFIDRELAMKKLKNENRELKHRLQQMEVDT